MQDASREEMQRYAEKIMAAQGYHFIEKKEISYGIQLCFEKQQQTCYVRIFAGKKGVRLDLSCIKDPDVLSAFHSETAASLPSSKSSPVSLPPVAYPFAGSDEAGKGDYFGPLVVCCALLDEEKAKKLEECGVRDSKTLTPAKISRLSTQMREMGVSYHISFFSPEKLNAMHEKGKNLNEILAFLHGRAAQGLLKQCAFTRLVVDRFANERLVANELEGANLDILQLPKAEGYLPVAAASILARDFYVSYMDQLSQKCGFVLPKGASSQTIEAARQFVQNHGRNALRYVAKVFFKTTSQL